MLNSFSNAHRSMSFFLPHLLLLLLNASGQNANANYQSPILLTGPSKNEFDELLGSKYETHSALPYQNLDQCLLQPGQEQVHSYGLHFHMHPYYLCEPDGLLICYPGQMDGNYTRNGLVSTIPFRIHNRKNNIPGQSDVTSQCEQQRKLFCQENAELCQPGQPGALPWHGILVKSYESGTRLILQLSIVDKIYDLDKRDHFWIDLSNRTSPFASIHFRAPDGKKKRVDWIEDEQKQQNFLKTIMKGAKIARNSLGLWALALDVLPTEAEQEIHIFTYRGCHCSMHSWFTRPTDTVEEPEVPAISVGHPQCPPKFTYQVIDLSAVREDTMLVLQMLVDDHPKELRLELLDKNGNSMVWMDMKVDRLKFGPPDRYKSMWNPISNQSLIGPDGPAFLRPGKELFWEMHFHAFYYEFARGPWPPQTIEMLWPIDSWWNKLPFDQMGQVVLHGDVVLMSEYQLMAGDSTRWVSAPLSYSLGADDEPIEVSMEISINGKVADDANWAQINFLHDAPEWHPNIGATLLSIHVNFRTDNITLEYYNDEHWKIGETLENEGIFKRGEPFECKISMYKNVTDSTAFALFSFNSPSGPRKFGPLSSSLPIWSLTHFQLAHGILILNEPEFKYNKDDQWLGHYNKKRKLPRPLRPSDQICIRSKQQENLQINFLHDSNELNNLIGDVVLQLKWQIDLHLPLYLRYQQSTYRHVPNNQMKIVYNQTAALNIGVFGDEFNLVFTITEKQWEIVEDKSSRFVYPHQMPPWTVDWIQFTGEDVSTTDLVECAKPNADLPDWIRQIPEDKPIVPGNQIIIHAGFLEDKVPVNWAWNVSVYLFHGALEWNKEFGKTLLMVKVSQGQVSLDTYMNGTWMFYNKTEHKYRLANSSLVPKQFEAKILVNREEFEIHIGQQASQVYKYPYKEYNIPLWAIQYIVMENNGQLYNIKSRIDVLNV